MKMDGVISQILGKGPLFGPQGPDGLDQIIPTQDLLFQRTDH